MRTTGWGVKNTSRRYFDYFFNTLGGNAMTPVEVKRFLHGNNSATDQ